MAASAITVQEIDLDGVEVTLEAANVDGNFFTNDGKTVLRVANGSGSSITVTASAQASCSQGHEHPVVVSVPAGDTLDIGNFKSKYYNDSSNYVQIAYSDVTTVTVAAVKAAN